MKQINHGFADYYYLCEDGTLYDEKKDMYKEADSEHKFKLKGIDGKRYNISLKSLYYIVYGKNFCVDNIQDLDGEEWREIEDTNGFYLISSCGRCKSFHGYESILLKPVPNERGYLKVSIRFDGYKQNAFVHKLVMNAFAEPPKNTDMQIHHKNGKRDQNFIENLCYLSRSEHAKIHREWSKRENEQKER